MSLLGSYRYLYSLNLRKIIKHSNEQIEDYSAYILITKYKYYSDLLINKPRLLVYLFIYFVIKQLIKPRGLILVVNQALYRLV
jgi:hypothetical protein